MSVDGMKDPEAVALSSKIIQFRDEMIRLRRTRTAQALDHAMDCYAADVSEKHKTSLILVSRKTRRRP
jgi:hypothetical protein